MITKKMQEGPEKAMAKTETRTQPQGATQRTDTLRRSDRKARRKMNKGSTKATTAPRRTQDDRRKNKREEEGEREREREREKERGSRERERERRKRKWEREVERTRGRERKEREREKEREKERER